MNLALGPVARITRSANYKWWVFSSVALGLFLTVTDQSGVNIALPRIAEHFGADLPAAQWIALGFTLSTSVMFMPVGRLSDIFGRSHVFMAGFAIFVAAAIIGGTAVAFPMLIAAKLLQGIGVAGIEANGMAMVADIFPERERGKAIGLYMSIIGAGAVGGPVIGGTLVSLFGWRSIYAASACVGIIALLLAAVVLRREVNRDDSQPARTSFDWTGAALSSIVLVCFLLSITNGHRLGWDSPVVLGGIGAAVASLALFVWWEGKAEAPMLDLTFFRSKVFSLGVSARFLSFLAGSAVYFIMPFYLVQGLGLEPSHAGLLMVPGSIAIGVWGPVSGRLSDKIGTRWLTVVGMALAGTGMLLFSTLDENSSTMKVMFSIFLEGTGIGLFSSPNTSAIMTAIDSRKFSVASAFLNLVRTSASLIGIAIFTAIVVFTMSSQGFAPDLSAVTETGGIEIKLVFIAGMKRAFFAAAMVMFAALIVSALRPENPRPAAD
ncbi:MAG: MFS transporter [Chloroflexi bacterium]|nr:MFS transporter [Chloroflexota bacterium]